MDFWNSTVGVIQGLVAGLGAVFCVLGAITLLRGFSDSNGPEQQKGWGQIIGGAGIIVVATTLVPMLNDVIDV